MCYRFVLSGPVVHVWLTAPANLRQFEANLAEVRRGPLPAGEMQFMRDFGDVVYGSYRYFIVSRFAPRSFKRISRRRIQPGADRITR